MCVCAEGGRKEEDTDDLKWGFQQEGGGSVGTPNHRHRKGAGEGVSNVAFSVNRFLSMAVTKHLIEEAT